MSVTCHPAPAARKRGFTLIELMVATGIMVLLVLAVMSMTGNVLDVWGNASGRLSANAEARNALQYLGDDLETLVVRPKKQVWLQVDYAAGGAPFSGDIPSLSFITATEHRDRSGTDYGNICAVNYQLAFQHPITADESGLTPSPIFGMYRTVVNPSVTFTNILSQGLEFQPDGEGGNVAENDLETLIQANITGGFASFKNFLSSHVANLDVGFYAENLTTGDVEDIDPDRKGFIYADKIYDKGGNVLTNFGGILYADIRMTVLSDEGAKAIAAAKDRGASGQYDDIIRSHGIVFTRRVPIMSRP